MLVQKLQDKHIDLEKIEFNNERMYILSRDGDMWGMGLNKNFRLKATMEEGISVLNRLDIEVQNFKLTQREMLKSENRSRAFSRKVEQDFSKLQLHLSI